MRQMELRVEWHISDRKLYFQFLMFQNGSKNQYLSFQQISRKSVKVEFLTYHVTQVPTSHRAKISDFQNMLGFIQYGSRLFGIDASTMGPSIKDVRKNLPFFDPPPPLVRGCPKSLKTPPPPRRPHFKFFFPISTQILFI